MDTARWVYDRDVLANPDLSALQMMTYLVVLLGWLTVGDNPSSSAPPSGAMNEVAIPVVLSSPEAADGAQSPCFLPLLGI
jgi:hypothetical protein